MNPFLPLSTEEQFTAHLRMEILKGRLSGGMPGVLQLAATLKTSPRTVTAAVRRLEQEGFLERPGAGRRSRIVIPEGIHPPGLRIEILLYEQGDLSIDYLIHLKYSLQEAGHTVSFSSKALADMDMDVKRVARHVQNTPADAWVIVAGSLPVLEWFAAQTVPALAIFGAVRRVPAIAGTGPEKKPALAVAVKRLTALGHRRIVMLVREDWRAAKPGSFERWFLDLLEAEGIRTGPYHLPDWQADAAGLCRSLDALFQYTPPTAIILDEPALFMAARLHLAQRGITSPQHVSIICLDPDPIFDWCHPAVSHVSWDTNAMVRRILQWANHVAHGKPDRRQTFFKARFIDGGTIGPVNRSGFPGWQPTPLRPGGTGAQGQGLVAGKDQAASAPVAGHSVS